MEELTINPFNNQRGGRSKLPQQKGERCNEAIRATEVLVIGADGEQLGTLPIAEALENYITLQIYSLIQVHQVVYLHPLNNSYYNLIRQHQVMYISCGKILYLKCCLKELIHLFV